LDTFLNTKFVTRYLKRTEKTATLENLLPWSGMIFALSSCPATKLMSK
jgi:hypothetical protein